MADNWLIRVEQQFGWTMDDFRRLVSHACRGLNLNDLDDAFQEVWLGLDKRFSSFDQPQLESRDALNGYVYKAARNCKQKYLRKQASERKKIASFDPSVVEEASTEELSRKDVLKSLTPEQRERIISFLPDDGRRLRDCMRLHLEGLTGIQISEKLGVSGSTVSRRINDCREYIEPRNSEVITTTVSGELSEKLQDRETKLCQ
jgi:RNA polymerase sigma factor (sigma-70 family)